MLLAAQMLCVSEYLPNGNLELAIRKDRERKDGKPRLLGWYKMGRPIAVDVARGLAFMHRHTVRACADCRGRWKHAQAHASIVVVLIAYVLYTPPL